MVFAFNLFRVLKCWQGPFTSCTTVPCCVLPVSTPNECAHVEMATVPMVWLFAVDSIHEVPRKIVFNMSGILQRLDVMPDALFLASGEWVLVCWDGFDTVRKRSLDSV